MRDVVAQDTKDQIQRGGRLMNVSEVAARLNVRSIKRVYELPIPFVQLSERSKRWLEEDVEAFIQGRKRGIAA